MHAMLRGVERYYVQRQLSARRSAKVNWLLGVVTTLQVATLLLPITGRERLPWRYDVFWPVWVAANAVSRPDRIMEAVLRSRDSTVYLFAVLLFLRTSTLAVSVLLLSTASEDQYWRLLSPKSLRGLKVYLQKADCVLLFLTSEAMFIPLASFNLTALLDESLTCSAQAKIAAGVLLVAALGISLMDRVASSDVWLRPENEGVINPSYILLFSGSNLVVALVVPVCLQQSHDFMLRLALFACGLVQVTYVYRDLPFSSHFRNTVESFQGLLFLLEVIVLTLALNTESSAVAPALLLLFVPPILLLVNNSLILTLEARIIRSGTQTEAVYARLLSSSEDGSPSPVLKPRLLTGMRLYPLIWTAYRSIQKRDTYALRLAVSLVAGTSRGLLDIVPVQALLHRAALFLETDSEEVAVQHFLRLNSLQDHIQRHDYHTTVLLRQFFQLLQGKNTEFERLELCAQRLQSAIQETLHLYKSTVQIFPKKISLLQTYSTFLELIGRYDEKLNTLINKLSQRKRRKEQSLAERLMTDDPKCAIFVVSLTGRDRDKIISTINPDLLGYTDDSLRGADFHLLIPETFQERHRVLIGNIHADGAVPRILQGPCRMHVVNKQKELIHGVWRIFVANAKHSGELVAVASIRVENGPKEFAVLGRSGVMECTPAFAEMTRSTRFLAEADFQTRSVAWKGDWNSTRIFVTREEWSVLDHLRLPILVLNRLRARGSAQNLLLLETKPTAAAPESEAFFTKPVRLSIADSFRTDYQVPGSSLEARINLRILCKQASVQRYKKLLCALLGMTLVGGSVICCVITYLFGTGVTQLDESIASISSFGMRRLSVRMAIRSKELFLLNANCTLFGNESAARDELRTGAEQMEQMRLNLIGNISTAQNPFRSMLVEQTIPFWQHEQSQFALYFVTLLDLMSHLAQRARVLSATPLSQVTANNSDFMTLYRNCAEEGLEAFNRSVGAFCASKDYEKEEMLSRLFLIAYLCPSLLLLSLCGSISLLTLTERVRRRVWQTIRAVPKSASAEVLEQVYCRLYNIHKDESVSSDIQTVNLQRRAEQYSTSLLAKMLLCCVIGFCVFVSLSGLVLYWRASARMEDILRYKATYMNYLGFRRVLAVKAQFLMRESWLPWQLSSANIVRGQQRAWSTPAEWEQTYSFMRGSNHCFESGCEAGNIHHLFPSDAQKDLLHGRACDNCTAALKAGITPLIDEIAQFSAAAKAGLENHEIRDYSKGAKIEKLISLLLPALSMSNDQFNVDCQESLAGAHSELVLELVLGESVLLGLLLFVVFPLLQHEVGRIQRELSMLTLFPKSAMAQIVKKI